MVRLVKKDTGEELGIVEDGDLEVMRRLLEEESATDTDYYLTEDTLELLAEGGLSLSAQSLLRKALEGVEGVEVRWERR